MVRSKVQIKTHLPSNKNQTLFSSPEYLTAGPQFKDGWVCVTTGEGAGGATWPLAKPYITLARGQDPPGSLPRGDTHTHIFGLRSRGRILGKSKDGSIPSNSGGVIDVWLFCLGSKGGQGNMKTHESQNNSGDLNIVWFWILGRCTDSLAHLARLKGGV